MQEILISNKDRQEIIKDNNKTKQIITPKEPTSIPKIIDSRTEFLDRIQSTVRQIHESEQENQCSSFGVQLPQKFEEIV